MTTKMTTPPAEVVPLEREMGSVEAVLLEQARNHGAWTSILLTGYDENGEVCFTSSEMTRGEQVMLLLDVLDAIRGVQ